jgi:hypothetical protein
MTRSRFLSRVALCAALFMTSTALECDFSICYIVGCPKPDNVLDGAWVLNTVNNSPISSYRPGFHVPGENEYVQTARLNFFTDDWDEDKHVGDVRALYASVTATGGARPNVESVGTFEYHPKTGNLTLRIALRSRDVRVAGTTIIASGTVPPFESASITFTKK